MGYTILLVYVVSLTPPRKLASECLIVHLQYMNNQPIPSNAQLFIYVDNTAGATQW